jgi:hypothetical protein
MNPVFALVERDGTARSFHMPNVEADNLRKTIAVHADRASHFMTDEARAFTGIGWNFASHGTVKQLGRRVRSREHSHKHRRRFLFDPKARRLRDISAR